jgi:hypothetical protein
VDSPVFAAPQLNKLHELMVDLLPRWSFELKVAKSEHSRDRLVIPRDGSLFHAVNEVAPSRFGIGRAILKGTYKGLTFFLNSCNSTLPPELNYVKVEILDSSIIEDQPFSGWAQRFLESVPALLPVRYGNARLSEEFATKNLVHEGGRTYALGVRLAEGLPGLYWLNFFGKPYVRFIGEDRLLSAPAYEVKKVGNGVLIALNDSPLSWQSADYNEREINTINHIGRDLFFFKGEAERQLKAPDFREG